MASLNDLIVSETRVKLLEVFLSHPEKIFYVRELTRLTGQQINAVRRELERMEKKKMVQSEKRGNRLYYRFQKGYPFYPQLLPLVAKTTGLGGAIIKNKNRIGKIKFAMLAGRFLKGREKEKNQVDLLLVGQVVLPQIASLIRDEEARKGEEINYTVMSEEEFKFRKRRQDPFITKVLSGSRVMLIGDEEEMIK